MADQTLGAWLNQRLAASKHAGTEIRPLPAIAGACDVIAAIGPEPHLAVYAAVRHGGESLRVGFAAKDRWKNEEIEEAVEGSGGDMTEWLEDEMEVDEDLPFKVQHFHEAGWFHFASDLAKPREFFETEEGRQMAWYFFDGYARAILPVLAKAEDE